MNYLVTGASGFVGRNLFNAFENHKCVNLAAWDRSKDFCSQIIAKDGIIHLAGKAHDIKEVSDPQDYYFVNTELTKTCFNAFLKSSASVFIYFSSVKPLLMRFREYYWSRMRQVQKPIMAKVNYWLRSIF
jgi:nucleoside-diphosphate-sugar epimerase